jgi:hypothetical protein
MRSRPASLRGVRTSRTLERDAVDADVLRTNSTDADGEVVWSCSPALFSFLRELIIRREAKGFGYMG